MRRVFVRWVPLIVWVIVIFALPNLLSLSESGPDLPNRFDKVVHFVEYMILAVLFQRGLARQPNHGRLPAFCAVVFAGLAVGALDEFTQYFIPQRDSSILDWIADASGILVGTSVSNWYLFRAKGRKESI